MSSINPTTYIISAARKCVKGALIKRPLQRKLRFRRQMYTAVYTIPAFSAVNPVVLQASLPP